ncbi:MAG: GntR family transcriptional regulator [Thermodesulfobacteriota bacterium]|jgi:DNA-binding GntR family transcriptional regulator
MGKDISTNTYSNRKGIPEVIKGKIANWTFGPGQRLTEIYLINVLSTTRNKIREALRQLEQEGFVKIIPNVGAKVIEFSQKDIENIYDILGALEGLAVRIITPFLRAEQLESLRILINKMEATNRISLFHKYNMKFHSLIIELSENERLIKLAENLRFSIRCASFQSMSSPGQMEASIKEHRRIFGAIKDRKSVKAEQLVRNHILHAKNRLMKYMNKSL